MFTKKAIVLMLIWAALILSGCSAPEPAPPTSTGTEAALPELSPTSQPLSEPTATATSLPEPTPTPTTPPEPTPVPDEEMLALHALISQEQLFAYIEDLSSLQSYSGWRNSATSGEAEGLDYVTEILGEFAYLESLGLELERQSFHVAHATEIWESRVFLTIDGTESEAPANAISGNRKQVLEAIRFDSDGTFNDADRNPLEVSGDVLLLRSADEVQSLGDEVARGVIAFLYFGAIEPAREVRGAGADVDLINVLLKKGIAGLVLVTESGGGKYAGDGTILEGIDAEGRVPMLYLRLEDLAPLGIDSWGELAQVQAARLVWDTDVLSPGFSGNLVARIPGADPSRAVVLGAHIDSINSPGAADNALNAAVLLELARVLDEAEFQPPADIYLVWFGSEEIGFYGSQHFVNTHQEVLDRALAAFLLDGFTADQPGEIIFAMQESSNVRFGDRGTYFGDYLIQKGEVYEVPIEFVFDSPIFASDDGPFYGFVPHVRFAFGSLEIGEAFHSPYDTPGILRGQEEMVVQSVKMALVAAVDTPQEDPVLRVTPEPERSALILATHTEALHMSPTLLLDLVRALAWEGFDVDVIPYGQFPSEGDLAEASLVVVLPVVDYPGPDTGPAAYDEAWAAEEVDLLVSYVEGGGLLVLANSANRLFFGEFPDANEDWEKLNALAEPFGVSYAGDPIVINAARVTGDHPLIEGFSALRLIASNGLPINPGDGVVLADAAGQAVLVLVDYGEAGGQVLVLADIGSLDLSDRREHERDNFKFLRNLACYAWER